MSEVLALAVPVPLSLAPGVLLMSTSFAVGRQVVC
jgi:hypothetical protein